MAPRKILVVGGAGYIGSHVCKALFSHRDLPIVYDNLSGGSRDAVKWGPLIIGDIRDASKLDETFLYYRPDAVIHLASYINVRESFINPSKYYDNNVSATLVLLHAMVKHEVKRLVFSSSAAVYGNPKYTPIDEEHPKLPTNPYGKSKWMVEQLLEDFYRSHGLCSISLRYFNAAGADQDAEIGETHDPETHLIPSILLTALKRRPYLTIFGEGTSIRDYVHVSDLATAHIKAVNFLEKNPTLLSLNLGTGKGYSVREALAQAIHISAQQIMTKNEEKQDEPHELVADPSKAKKILGWEPSCSTLENIVKTAWAWHNRQS